MADDAVPAGVVAAPTVTNLGDFQMTRHQELPKTVVQFLDVREHAHGAHGADGCHERTSPVDGRSAKVGAVKAKDPQPPLASDPLYRNPEPFDTLKSLPAPAPPPLLDAWKRHVQARFLHEEPPTASEPPQLAPPQR